MPTFTGAMMLRQYQQMIQSLRFDQLLEFEVENLMASTVEQRLLQLRQAMSPHQKHLLQL
jgi:hypothetical protein